MADKKKKRTNSRAKGTAYEQDRARMFGRWFEKARRGLQFQEGEHCPDIVKTPWYVECKRGAKVLQWVNAKGKKRRVDPLTQDMLEIYQYYYYRMTQWRDDGGNDCPVIIVWKLDKKQNYVTLSSALWDELIGAPESETQYILTASWDDFAAALDEIYPIQKETV